MPDVDKMAVFKETEAFKRLTGQEQVFVEEYIRNRGNATKAAAVAYNTTNDKSAASLGHRTLERNRIQEALAVYAGTEHISEAEFWNELKRCLIQNDSWSTKINALKLYAEVSGMTKSKAETNGLDKETASIINSLLEPDGKETQK